jgi:hypothetical protein
MDHMYFYRAPDAPLVPRKFEDGPQIPPPPEPPRKLFLSLGVLDIARNVRIPPTLVGFRAALRRDLATGPENQSPSSVGGPSSRHCSQQAPKVESVPAPATRVGLACHDEPPIFFVEGESFTDALKALTDNVHSYQKELMASASNLDEVNPGLSDRFKHAFEMLEDPPPTLAPREQGEMKIGMVYAACDIPVGLQTMSINVSALNEEEVAALKRRLESDVAAVATEASLEGKGENDDALGKAMPPLRLDELITDPRTDGVGGAMIEFAVELSRRANAGGKIYLASLNQESTDAYLALGFTKESQYLNTMRLDPAAVPGKWVFEQGRWALAKYRGIGFLG